MTQRLVQVYGYKKYKNANMLMTKSFDVYGDNRGVINSEPSFLKPEVSDELIDLMNETGSPLYLEADVNKKNHSNLTKVDWASADLNSVYTDEPSWLANTTSSEIVKDTLGISYDLDEDFALPVGLDISNSTNPIDMVDKDKPFYSAIDNGRLDSGAGIFDKDPESYAANEYIPHSIGYQNSLLSPETFVLVAKGDTDIHLMQYDSNNHKVNISDINDLPDLLQANLRMTYLSQTKNLNDLVVLDNIHTNRDTLNDDFEKVTDQSKMPRIARDYLFLTSGVKDPQGNIIDMAGIIDEKARENGEVRLAQARERQRQYEREALLKPIDDEDIEFDF